MNTGVLMPVWTQEQVNSCIGRCCDRSAVDPDFRTFLLADPAKAAHQETGWTIPAGISIKVLESSPGYDYTILMPPLVSGILEDDTLDSIVGGGDCGEFHINGACGIHSSCALDDVKKDNSGSATS